MGWRTIALAYTAPFGAYALLPTPMDQLFIAAYFAAIVISLVIPLRDRETDSPVRSDSKYLGLAAALLADFLISGYLGFLSALAADPKSAFHSSLLGEGPTKYFNPWWIFFSVAMLVAAPGVRLTKLGNFLRKNGIEGMGKLSEFWSRDEHFFLEYSTQHWFRHANFSLFYLGLFGLYFYGWSFLGLPFLLFSVSLFILISLIVRNLAKTLLSPFDPMQVIAQLESTYPARTFKANFRRPSPGAIILIGALVASSAFSVIVTNPFAGTNLIIFILLIVVFALTLFIHAATSSSTSRPSRGKPLTSNEKIFVLATFLAGAW